MKILQEAVLSVLKDTLNVDLVESSVGLSHSFASEIALDSRVFVIITNKPLLRRFALDFLGDSAPNNDTLIDISKEISNLIIGKMKVLYEQQKGEDFRLGIPVFLGNKVISRYNWAIHYKYQKIRCSIYEV